MKHCLLLILSLLIFGVSAAQQTNFSHADSLRGTLNANRSCYDVTYYDLSVTVDIDQQEISGTNLIHFEATGNFKQLQIDLFAHMEIEKISFEGKELSYKRKANAVIVDMNQQIKQGSQGILEVSYSGKPIVAKMPPWDGGFVWSEGPGGKPWVGVACEGMGASSWWPLKDHLSDEPDSMSLRITPVSAKHPDLMAVGNGQFRGLTEDKVKGAKTWNWFVSYPINSYNVTVNIADYAHLHDTYTNESGTHDLDYYVLKGNEEKAKVHFEQVHEMMDCFEKHFGEYPFWRDGYALVETDYWGMEHQGAVAYGNKYKNNEFGWDFIIIHETGHEWWGNNISCSDHAELWIHESFCTYSEAVFMECNYSYDKMIKYLWKQRMQIRNVHPISGPLGVNYNEFPDADMYYKGSWMLHTLRTLIGDDELWFSILKDMNTEFAYQTTNSTEIIAYINKRTGRDFSAFFDQYLNHKLPPRLEIKRKKKGKNTELCYRWESEVKDFAMDLDLKLPDGTLHRLHPTSKWQKVKLPVKPEEIKVDMDHYYVQVKDAK